ncbi:hypothetical protein [Naasia sp. SYSU D00057]|uniref:hypothetical protein n=1 Tax=Naasia sp. SYSU D00057 TaxID=2817380 RepID=UPI001B318153|nr:hypothetical protein [Naasia sp. SYSU D00057]
MAEDSVPEIEGVWAVVSPTTGELEVTWETNGPPPSAGFETLLLSVWVPREQGALQFGLKLIRGEDPVVFLFNHGISEQKTSASADVKVGANARQTVAFFPEEWFASHRLRGQVPAEGIVNIDGIDLDRRFDLTIDFGR